MRAVRIEEFGGPEVLRLVDDQPEPEARPGQVVLDVTSAGVNYADTHQTEDTYFTPVQLPLVPGVEVVGTTPDGRRVVTLLPGGGYAQRAVADEPLCVDVPDEVGDGQALAVALQGLTAWHLYTTSARLRPGESVVVHAAAGGVGSLAVQLARRFGAGRVVAVASTDDKRRLALDLGADVAVDAGEEDLTSAIEEANGGKVDVVLEMVGGRTTDQSLAALAPLGRLVLYGLASLEPPSPIDPRRLLRRSRGVLGFWLAHCVAADPVGNGREPMRELLELVVAGELRPVVGATHPLSRAADAHRDLRARRTVGKVLLDPST